MKPILKALTISTVVVVGYPIAVFAVLVPFAVLSPYQARVALNALWMPLELPTFIMCSLYPSEHLVYGRTPIEQTLPVLGWYRNIQHCPLLHPDQIVTSVAGTETELALERSHKPLRTVGKSKTRWKTEHTIRDVLVWIATGRRQ